MKDKGLGKFIGLEYVGELPADASIERVRDLFKRHKERS